MKDHVTLKSGAIHICLHRNKIH